MRFQRAPSLLLLVLAVLAGPVALRPAGGHLQSSADGRDGARGSASAAAHVAPPAAQDPDALRDDAFIPGCAVRVGVAQGTPDGGVGGFTRLPRRPRAGLAGPPRDASGAVAGVRADALLLDHRAFFHAGLLARAGLLSSRTTAPPLLQA